MGLNEETYVKCGGGVFPLLPPPHLYVGSVHSHLHWKQKWFQNFPQTVSLFICPLQMNLCPHREPVRVSFSGSFREALPPRMFVYLGEVLSLLTSNTIELSIWRYHFLVSDVISARTFHNHGRQGWPWGLPCVPGTHLAVRPPGRVSAHQRAHGGILAALWTDSVFLSSQVPWRHLQIWLHGASRRKDSRLASLTLHSDDQRQGERVSLWLACYHHGDKWTALKGTFNKPVGSSLGSGWLEPVTNEEQLEWSTGDSARTGIGAVPGVQGTGWGWQSSWRKLRNAHRLCSPAQERKLTFSQSPGAREAVVRTSVRDCSVSPWRRE